MKLTKYITRIMGLVAVAFMLLAVNVYTHARVNPVADTIVLNIQCANGRMGQGKCPDGEEYTVSGVIFSENFDAQADWTTTGRQALPAELPTGWDFARTDEEWHPADGDVGTQPSMMINGDNPNQVHGGSGKAFITYSESFNALDDNGWASDGFIGKDIDPTDELYAKFDIKFQSGWADNNTGGQIKIFRALSYDGVGSRNKFFSDGNTNPAYIFDWAQNNYGARHFHAFRCDDQQTNYFCTDPTIAGAPRQITTGDMSANFTNELTALSPQIPDLVNGGFLPSSGTVYHNQVWGDIWHTVEIHLNLNSAPGVRDGVLQWWLDGEKIFSMTQIPWIGTNGSMAAKWNSFSFGGNDNFHFDLVGAPADRERWYALDNIEIYNVLPEGL